MDEINILSKHLSGKGLKLTRQRKTILDAFLKTEKHLTVEALLEIVRKRDSGIGIATVYRTLHLLCDCGLCREIIPEDGVARYEHLFGHAHHDHLICTRCGTFVEVVDPEIERLQERLAQKYGFHPERHRMEMYGLCRKCKEAQPMK